LEGSEVGKFGRLWRPEILGGRNFLEVREVGKFGRLGMSRNLGGREVWKGWEGGRILSPVMNVFLQLHVDCVSYHSGDYRTERLVLSITVVLHVVQIYINMSIYYSVVHHPRQKPFWDTNTATMISSDRDDKNWEYREVGKFRRLRRPESLEGQEV
jgi:hypothetical protein